MNMRSTVKVDFLPLELILVFSPSASWSSWCPSGGSRRACGRTTWWTWSSSTQRDTWTCCPASRTCSAGKPAFPLDCAVQFLSAYMSQWMIHRRPVFSMLFLLLLLMLMNCSNSAERQIIQYVLAAQWLRCHWIHTCGCCLFCTCDVFGSEVALFHPTVSAPLGSTRHCRLHFMTPLERQCPLTV